MSFFGWLFAMACIDEYAGVIAGIIIGLPLCFVNPIIGIAAGLITWYSVNHYRGE